MIIQFETRSKAPQLVKDNIEVILKSKVPGKSGELRDTFFNPYLDDDRWKIDHATRLLTSKIADSKRFDPMPIKAFKYQ